MKHLKDHKKSIKHKIYEDCNSASSDDNGSYGPILEVKPKRRVKLEEHEI